MKPLSGTNRAAVKSRIESCERAQLTLWKFQPDDLQLAGSSINNEPTQAPAKDGSSLPENEDNVVPTRAWRRPRSKGFCSPAGTTFEIVRYPGTVLGTMHRDPPIPVQMALRCVIRSCTARSCELCTRVHRLSDSSPISRDRRVPGCIAYLIHRLSPEIGAYLIHRLSLRVLIHRLSPESGYPGTRGSPG
eukprot:2607150-Rhodomonas_salina.2